MEIARNRRAVKAMVRNGGVMIVADLRSIIMWWRAVRSVIVENERMNLHVYLFYTWNRTSSSRQLISTHYTKTLSFHEAVFILIETICLRLLYRVNLVTVAQLK